MAFISSPSIKKPRNSTAAVLRPCRNLSMPRRRWRMKTNRNRTVDDFLVTVKLGEGTYGDVYKARDRRSNKLVAMKKFKPASKNKERDQRTEIKCLQLCRHPSVVELKEVVLAEDRKSPVMIMEFAGGDLKNALKAYPGWLPEDDVKFLMFRLLQGVKCLHDNRIIHRDLKTLNILVDKNLRCLKICDFGLACRHKPWTHRVPNNREVVTLRYRAPELLLGTAHYTAAIDMWSVGCIMAELLTKRTLFKGETEEEMLGKIVQVRGTMTEETWPGVEALPDYAKVRGVGEVVKRPCARLRKYLRPSSPVSLSGLNLLKGLLTYDPKERMSVDDALCNSWLAGLSSIDGSSS